MRRFCYMLMCFTLVVFAVPTASTQAATTQLRPTTDQTTGTKTATGTVTVPDTYQALGILNTKFAGSDSTVRLPDGRVLITGGQYRHSCNYQNATIYDPVAKQTTFLSMQYRRAYHQSIVLFDGRVLLTPGTVDWECGDNTPPAEVFNPLTDTFTVMTDTTGLPPAATAVVAHQVVIVRDNQIQSRDPLTQTTYVSGTLASTHASYQLVALGDGRILLADNSGSLPSEVYDPLTGAVATVGHMTTNGIPVLLHDGRVFFLSYTGDTEYFDPRTGTFTPGPTTLAQDQRYAAVETDDGRILTVSRKQISVYDPISNTFTAIRVFANSVFSALPVSDGELVIKEATNAGYVVSAIHLVPGNTFNGSLVVPDPWINRNTFKVRFEVESTTAPLQSYAVASDNAPPTDWQPVIAGEPMTATTTISRSGNDVPIALYLRDINGKEGKVVATTVNVDTGAPTSSMTRLPTYSPATFTIAWTYDDDYSGVATVAVEVREGETGAWRRVVESTKATTATFTGTNSQLYQFRVRAIDVAGNVQAWPTTYASTTVATVAPTGTFQINQGAHATTGINVALNLTATATASPVKEMRIATDGTFGAWMSYANRTAATLSRPDGVKEVGVQFRDVVGNVSTTIIQTIRLDTAVEQNPTLSINGGAYYTRNPNVTLSIGAPLRTAAMQISNDGTFNGPWLPFDTTASWVLELRGQYTIARTVSVRLRDTAGTISPAFGDAIVYDPQPPEGSVSITSVAATSIVVQVTARDEVSKPSELRMRLSTNPQFNGAEWQPYTTSATLPRAGDDVKVYAQFEDGAGNRSTITCRDQNGGTCAAPAAVQVYLPLVRH